jgi:hypothetical protein
VLKEAKTQKSSSMASEPTRRTSERGRSRGKGCTHGTKRAGAEIMAPERKRAATSKGGKQTLCQKHADEIRVLLLDKQLAPAKIAETLCIINFLLPGHGWTGHPAHEEGGAEWSTRRWSLGEIPGYLQEIQAWGSQRQTPNSNPPEGSAGPGDSPRRSGWELPS